MYGTLWHTIIHNSFVLCQTEAISVNMDFCPPDMHLCPFVVRKENKRKEQNRKEQIRKEKTTPFSINLTGFCGEHT